MSADFHLAEIARLQAEMKRLTHEQDQFQADLGCGLHDGFKLVWCGECIRIDRAKAEAVVRAAEDVARHLHNLQVWTDRLTEFPYEAADRLDQALDAYREQA